MWYTRIEGKYIIDQTEEVDFLIDDISEVAEFKLSALYECLQFCDGLVDVFEFEHKEYYK